LKKNILFVGHDASRTGAPIVLGHLMRWLKYNGETEITVLLKKGGEMESDLSGLWPVWIWQPGEMRTDLAGKVLAKLNYKVFGKPLYQPYPGGLKNKKFDLVYLNTVATTNMLPELKKQYNCPVILHVHENEYVVKAHYAENLNNNLLKLVDHYIAVSESTRENLVDNFAIDKAKISLVNDFIPVKNIAPVKISAEQIRVSLGITNEFLVGASGAARWRKGADIFVQLAAIVSGQLKGKVKFVWVGETEHLFKCQLEYELKRTGLADEDIIFTGQVNNPLDYFRLFDVFVLPSREDPFPLVCLEAASVGKPLICFDKAGGMPEFLKGGGGIIVPYGDVPAMASAVTALYNDRDRLKALSIEAKDNVQQYDVDIKAPEILKVIDSLVAKK